MPERAIKLKTTIIVVGSLLLGAAGLRAGQVSGTVTMDSLPVQQALVAISCANRALSNTTTDGDGFYQMEVGGGGSCDLSVTHGLRYATIKIRLGQQSNRYDLKMNCSGVRCDVERVSTTLAVIAAKKSKPIAPSPSK